MKEVDAIIKKKNKATAIVWAIVFGSGAIAGSILLWKTERGKASIIIAVLVMLTVLASIAAAKEAGAI